MKLPDFYHDDRLIQLKISMGLSANDYGRIMPVELENDFRERLSDRIGIEVELKDVYFAQDGTLIVENGQVAERIVLYIRDSRGFEPKFHVANCRTLQSMREMGRSERYVETQNESGVFVVNYIRGGVVNSIEKKLHPCQNCLYFLMWQGFDLSLGVSEKEEIIKNFDLKDFFKIYPKTLHQTIGHTSEYAPIDMYPKRWQSISRSVRERSGWVCQVCGLNLSAQEHQKFLHVHHKSGSQTDNSRRNLIVLCIGCHANEPQHGHMKKSSVYVEFVQKFGTR